MRHKYVTYEKYLEMWDNIKRNMQIQDPSIDPVLKEMRIEGSPYPNEYERLLDQWRNPRLPAHIDMLEEEETVRYKIDIKPKPLEVLWKKI